MLANFEQTLAHDSISLKELLNESDEQVRQFDLPTSATPQQFTENTDDCVNVKGSEKSCVAERDNCE